MSHSREEERRPVRRRRGSEPEKKSAWRELAEWVGILVGAYLVALVISTFIFQVIPVSGESMTPTLENGERMFVTKFTYAFREPEHREIVITRYPDSDALYVKRVIGLPGDTVEVKHGKVYLNGEALDESYIRDQEIRYEMDEVVVAEGEVFVLGDNRNDSKDSHSVGALPRDYLVGCAQCVIWPLDGIRSLHFDPAA